jgi:hypothetical protein
VGCWQSRSRDHQGLSEAVQWSFCEGPNSPGETSHLYIVALAYDNSQESKDKDSNKELAKAGAIIVPFDVDSDDATAALKDIDVLISTVSGMAIKTQSKLIPAAAKAGIKLFVPANWSFDKESRGTFIDDVTEGMHQEAVKAGLKTATFFCGAWSEFWPYFGFDLAHGKITIHGKGEQPVSMTSNLDVADYVVHALTTFSRERLENASFYIEGERIVSLLLG